MGPKFTFPIKLKPYGVIHMQTFAGETGLAANQSAGGYKICKLSQQKSHPKFFIWYTPVWN